MRTEGLRRRSFAGRYLTLFGGEVFAKLCVFATFAYLARVLGPREFGLIELSLSITGLFVLFAEMGLGSLGARVIERSPELASSVVPQVALLRLLLAVPAYLSVLFLSYRYGMSGVSLFAVYGVLVLLTPFFTQWVFQGLHQMQWVAAASALRYAVFALVVALLVRQGSDSRLVAFAEVCGAVAVALFNTGIGLRVLHLRIDWRGALRGALKLLRHSWYLGASELAWSMMWYAPSVMTGWMLSYWPRQIAWLAAAVRIVMAIHTFVWLYFYNLLPNLSKEIRSGPEAWRDLVDRSVAGSTWVACFVALSGTLLASAIVETVYGPAYRAAVVPFQIAIWMIPVAWFSGHFRFSLIASGHQRLECAASAAAVVVTVAVTYVGIRMAGANGAAVGLVAGGTVNAALAGAAAARVIGPMRLASATAPFIACLGAMAIGLIGARAGAPKIAALAALLFFLVRAANRAHLERLRRTWRSCFE